MKVEKNVKTIAKIAIPCAIIALLVGIWIGKAATPTSTFYLSPGVYPGAPSFTFWRETNDYFAKDGNGQLRYSGTNASQVYNYALSQLSSGGKVLFKEGTYIFTQRLVIPYSNIEIWGEGWSTILQMGNAVNLEGVIYSSGKDNILVTHLQIDGNGAQQTSGQCLELLGGENITVSYCYLHDGRDRNLSVTEGNKNNVKVLFNTIVKTYVNADAKDNVVITEHDDILVEGNTISNGAHINLIAGAGGDSNIRIVNNRIFGANGSNIFLDGNSTHYLRNIVVSGNSLEDPTGNDGYGIQLGNYVEDFIVSNNEIYNTLVGIRLDYCYKGSITGNTIKNSYRQGIQLSNCGNITLTGNIVTIVSIETTNTYSGVEIYNCNHIDLANERIFDDATTKKMKWGIIETGTSDYNMIISCNTRDSGVTGGIFVIGTNTKVNLCWNATTWVS